MVNMPDITDPRFYMCAWGGGGFSVHIAGWRGVCSIFVYGMELSMKVEYEAITCSAHLAARGKESLTLHPAVKLKGLGFRGWDLGL